VNKIRALGLGLFIFQLISLAIIGLSLHTVLNILTSTISGETFNFELNADEVTETLIFTLNANPRNTGYFDVKLFMELALLNVDEQYIVRNSTSVNIKAGSTTPFSLNLFIPVEATQGMSLEQNVGTLEVTFTVKTLGDLVGLTNILKIREGD